MGSKGNVWRGEKGAEAAGRVLAELCEVQAKDLEEEELHLGDG
ncbi:hypothetical protein [Candidatus Methylacidithermus pantelleriae]|uniref:Uncharacterized protein n=1 Tax=Candidatus Methylacidithermus pantelleriae TaxID=2744239 RepID=A0A8J2BVD2_9BACT|nr:hypothetical protein [Candidatus Methylacidithermus pantelleriae]CAF0702060.1 hypothetical protein MPNT_460013 [Candidatus Methylacidithermus pantelleriae]